MSLLWPPVQEEMEQLARTVIHLSILAGEQAGWPADETAAIRFAETALQVAGEAEKLAGRALGLARESLRGASFFAKEDGLPF